MALRLPVLFILMTVVLDSMGVGLIMPIMPDLIREVHGGTLSNAALWGGVLTTVFAVMQFAVGPLIGNLSDRFGRRPVLLVSLCVMALDYLVMAVAGSIWLLLAGRIVGGITAATHATASAYMADISKPGEKSANFALIGAGYGIGFVLGPLLGGVLGEYGTRAPFYAAAALSALNFTLGLFVLKETVTDRIRRPFRWARANPLAAFGNMAHMPGIRPLLLVYFIYSVALYVYPVIWAYFTQAQFGWSPQIIGLSLAVYGISSAIVQTVLIRFMLVRVGDARTVVYGFVFDMLACGAIAIVTDGTLALFLTPVAALGSIATPALQGIMSQRVDDDAQGELQGILTSMAALATVVSPMMMTTVFSAFTAPTAPVHFPGAPFVLAMLLVVAGLLVFLRVFRNA
ncbi:TCR/Tet family MFS transporter [Arenibacterium sp. CAU 1754]